MTENFSNLTFEAVKALLDNKVEEYNTSDFIPDDPISLPHQFQKKEDIEIIGFIVALIAWGKRMMILKNGKKLIQLMSGQPYEFVKHYEKGMLDGKNFVHRTFNTTDLDFILHGLQLCYSRHGSLSALFQLPKEEKGIKLRIMQMRAFFLTLPHEKRSEKHLANPVNGSAAKKINMFLRWMVRKDKKGVDFGIWNAIPMHELYVPLDVHSGRIARELGLIKRKQNDWKALEELMTTLRKMDPNDPSKYDFALFGLGVTGALENTII